MHMALNGLSNKEKAVYSVQLASGKRLKNKAEKTVAYKTYLSIITELTTTFDKALKEKNFIKIFDLESVAQKHDAKYFSSNSQKSLEQYAGLQKLKEIFVDGLDPEKVRKQFLPSVEELNAVGVRVVDKVFATSIRSQSRSLAAFIGNRSTQAERDYYEKRQDCLIAIGREHQKNIDRAMGYEPAKSREQARDKGLSR